MHTERRYELGHIPKSEIVKYADRVGLSGNLLNPFCIIISELDGHYLKIRHDKIVNARPPTTAMQIKGLPNV